MDRNDEEVKRKRWKRRRRNKVTVGEEEEMEKRGGSGENEKWNSLFYRIQSKELTIIFRSSSV